MLDIEVLLELDVEADAAYVRLSRNEIVETVELVRNVVVDLDQHRMVVGFEILGFTTKIPFEELKKEFHLDSKTIDRVRQIQPTIEGFLSLTKGFDGTMAATSKKQLASV